MAGESGPRAPPLLSSSPLVALHRRLGQLGRGGDALTLAPRDEDVPQGVAVRVLHGVPLAPLAEAVGEVVVDQEWVGGRRRDRTADL